MLRLLRAGTDTKARSAAGMTALQLAKKGAAKPATADTATAPAKDHAGCVRALTEHAAALREAEAAEKAAEKALEAKGRREQREREEAAAAREREQAARQREAERAADEARAAGGGCGGAGGAEASDCG